MKVRAPRVIVDGVDQDDVDDDQEAQRRHRDEIAGEPHQRRADDERERGADEPGDEGRRQEGQADRGEPVRQVGQVGVLCGDRQRQDAGHIGADRDEADMAEREDAGEAVGDAHRGDQHGVDAHHDQRRARHSR